VTPLDRLIQRIRIRKALPHIPKGGRLLDVGCADGSLIRATAGRVSDAVGIDPDAPAGPGFVRGSFPKDLRDRGPYDVIALLAVFEHVPDEERAAFVAACRDLLRAGGRVVMTVPAPLVDRIIDTLRRFRLVHGMDIEAHHGYRPEETPAFFAASGMNLITHERFELGLNHLFVFEVPAVFRRE
jgi:2-polyprenyl-3-methyl-5-hydroxy-6-metoxy-1,4-benzoquinol methylase